MEVEVTQTEKPTITVTEAKQLDRKIRITLDGMETYTLEFWELTAEMRETLAYKHLGFKTWAEYLHDLTVNYVHVKNSGDQLIMELSAVGLSTYEIAAKVNVDQRTVRRAIKRRKKKLDDLRPNALDKLTKSNEKSTNGSSNTNGHKEINPQAQLKPAMPLGCAKSDGFAQAFVILSRRTRALIGSNLTYEQVEKVERLLVRSLDQIRKVKGEFTSETPVYR